MDSSGMDSQEGRWLASYITSYTALSRVRARSRTACLPGSVPPAWAYPAQNARLVAAHPVAGGRAGALLVGVAGQLVPGGVVERAEHARHVAQRRCPGAPLGQRHHGLALEVQQYPPGLGANHLPEVVVTVNPLDRQRLVDAAPAR